MKNDEETPKETWQAPEITDLDVKKDTEGKPTIFDYESYGIGPS
jgi:hypothetical protein